MVEVSGLFKRFDYHYKNHVIEKNEFGNITKQEYLDMAIQAKNQRVDSINVQQKIRSDGSINKYNIKENILVSYTSEGKILTFFKPKDGIAYWDTITN